MNSNTLLVFIVDGGLALFFLYALYYISQLGKRQKETTRLETKQREEWLEKSEPAIKIETRETEEPQVTETVEGDELSTKEEMTIEEQDEDLTVPDVKEKVKGRLEGIDIIDIEGIGPAYSSKLYDIGINTVSDLLERGGSPQGREDIAEKTEISPKLILEWVNHADLYRIEGVEGQFADLLEEGGVDTVPELARRNPENLYNRMLEVNEEKNLVNILPELDDVKNWIEEAKKLPRKIHY
jgi:predicted flap endonuclease-1-like 5' DNA nuclease